MGKREDKRLRILEAGLGVISEKGYNGTGVKDIVDAAGIPKGSFYNYFESKEVFVVEMLEHICEQKNPGLAASLGPESGLPPKQRLIAYFKSHAEEAGENGFKSGCLIGNLCQEMADQSELIQQKSCEIFRYQVSLIESCLQEARDQGQLAQTLEPGLLAEFLFNAWEGTLMRMKASHCSQALDVFLDTLNQLLEP